MMKGMNNVEPQNRRRTGNKGSFKPGQSGNPGGRPRRTDEERDALEEIRKLAADVPGKLKTLLNDKRTPPAVRLKACEIILDRTYGKPDSRLKLEPPKVDMLDDIKATVEQFRAEEARRLNERR